MTSFALLFTLSAIGISETVYLIRTRFALDKPICPIGENCTVVLTSKYNKLFFVHNDILGLLCYVALAMGTAFLVIEIPPMWLWDISVKILVGVSSVVSIFFMYLQWNVIKAWCFWCVLSAITIWIMGIILITSSLI